MHQLLFYTATLLNLALGASISKRWDEVRTRHEWHEVPAGYEDLGPAPENTILNLRIGLTSGGFDDLLQHLDVASDPTHEKYGVHLFKEDVDALIAPNQETISLVDSWILHHGILPTSLSRSEAGDWLTLNVTVAAADAMLGASYHAFYYTESDTTLIRTLRYELPIILHEHITVVAPTTYFGGMHAMRSKLFDFGSSGLGLSVAEAEEQLKSIADSSNSGNGGASKVPTSCSTSITPACLRAIYNVNYSPKTASSKNMLGVTGYLGQYANFNDLKLFYNQFEPSASGSNFSTVLINGGLNDQTLPGGEANVDTQYAGALSYPAKNIFYSTGGNAPFIADDNTPVNTNEPYLDFLDYIKNQKELPSVITTSYGDDEQTVPLDYANTVCNAFAQLGARGVSVIFASGDTGVGGGECLSNDGTNKTKFMPAFPATCPYVTSVGSTLNLDPEEAAFFTAGGFSYYFDTPSYQKSAVEKYVKYLGDEYAGLYNPKGRGVPDVSLMGVNYNLVYDGITYGDGNGTSVSAPAFAGLVSLLNDIRLSSGKSTLGFLNPLLYGSSCAVGNVFNDINIGSNPGCGTNGFNSTIGWDPVSGLGSPNFAKIRQVVENS